MSTKSFSAASINRDIAAIGCNRDYSLQLGMCRHLLKLIVNRASKNAEAHNRIPSPILPAGAFRGRDGVTFGLTRNGRNMGRRFANYFIRLPNGRHKRLTSIEVVPRFSQSQINDIRGLRQVMRLRANLKAAGHALYDMSPYLVPTRATHARNHEDDNDGDLDALEEEEAEEEEEAVIPDFNVTLKVAKVFGGCFSVALTTPPTGLFVLVDYLGQLRDHGVVGDESIYLYITGIDSDELVKVGWNEAALAVHNNDIVCLIVDTHLPFSSLPFMERPRASPLADAALVTTIASPSSLGKRKRADDDDDDDVLAILKKTQPSVNVRIIFHHLFKEKFGITFRIPNGKFSFIKHVEKLWSHGLSPASSLYIYSPDIGTYFSHKWSESFAVKDGDQLAVIAFNETHMSDYA